MWVGLLEGGLELLPDGVGVGVLLAEILDLVPEIDERGAEVSAEPVRVPELPARHDGIDDEICAAAPPLLRGARGVAVVGCDEGVAVGLAVHHVCRELLLRHGHGVGLGGVARDQIEVDDPELVARARGDVPVPGVDGPARLLEARSGLHGSGHDLCSTGHRGRCRAGALLRRRVVAVAASGPEQQERGEQQQFSHDDRHDASSILLGFTHEGAKGKISKAFY